MPIGNILDKMNWAVLKQKMFRRELEASFYHGKLFKLPQIFTSDIIQSVDQVFHLKSALYTGRAGRLNSECPAVATEIIALADKVIAGEYSFLGHQYKTDINDEAFWRIDYQSGHKYPLLPSWTVELSPVGTEAEAAIPFLLGRFHQFTWLALAYQFTKDEKYVDQFLLLFQSFIKYNPMGIGIQWADSQDAAIRLVNFYVALCMVYDSGRLTPENKSQFYTFILSSAVFLESGLYTGRNRDHRYFSVLLGVFLAGLVLEKSEFGKRMLVESRHGLEAEIRAQVFQDGVLYFHSTASHAAVVEALNLLCMWSREFNIQFSDDFRGTYRKLIYVLQVYLQTDCRLPDIGDTVIGYMINFENRSSASCVKVIESTSAMMIGQALVQKEVSALTAEHFIWFDSPGRISINRANIHTGSNMSIGFQNGGHYLFKSSDVSIFIKASDIGRKGQGPPGHNDSFTFELFYDQQPFIVDSGTNSLYTNPELRNALRSVMHHNTAYVDMTQLAEFIGTTGIKRDLTKPSVLTWATDETEDKLVAQHFAYVRLADPVIYKRTFHFQKEKRKFRIKDEFVGGAEHIIASNLYFHESVEVYRADETRFILTADKKVITLDFHLPCDEHDVFVQDVQYSPVYGRLSKTKRIHLQFRDRLPAFYSMEFRFL